ncbi:type II toxin-antitoxin system HicB family antitoxin [Mycolicibacterium palauense]|uniref:type II toxin-antitoxin system HicB family antitoxin n=1 Tax=Mycolicibacterium palauense TaxID=2034511 RepID=UPI000BFF0521|nr:toxin-antitoxin system HicB family antitoxin [Mycolicibacterium palauense]
MSHSARAWSETGEERCYTYRAEWSSDRRTYVGRCLEFPRMFEFAPTPQQAIGLIEDSVRERLDELAEVGEDAPLPLHDLYCSGRFVVRTSQALHARLVIEAREQGVSLNQWVVQKLADRPPNLDW